MNTTEIYLTFIRRVGKNKYGQHLAEYLCTCGNVKIIQEQNVKNGSAKSCGCYRKAAFASMAQKSITHHLSSHPLYRIWNGIIRRCYDIKASNYDRYGGRGVRVCDEWKNDFKVFYDWAISNNWAKGLQIDKDIQGSGFLYSPDNCLIVTPKENSNSKRNSNIVEINGEAKTISEWALKSGIKYLTLYTRLFRLKWAPIDAISIRVTK